MLLIKIESTEVTTHWLMTIPAAVFKLDFLATHHHRCAAAMRIVFAHSVTPVLIVCNMR
jgi:hypothetical protein